MALKGTTTSIVEWRRRLTSYSLLEGQSPNKKKIGQTKQTGGFNCRLDLFVSRSDTNTPGNIHSAHVLFGATNTRAGWCWKFVSHGQTNKPESRVFHSFSYTNKANDHRMPMPMRMRVYFSHSHLALSELHRFQKWPMILSCFIVIYCIHISGKCALRRAQQCKCIFKP